MYLLTSEGVRERAIRIQVQINTDLNAGKTDVAESVNLFSQFNRIKTCSSVFDSNFLRSIPLGNV